MTSVSGRGVGMDVVRNNIDQIGGTVDVKSVPGEGSSFIIKIPLTLAIVSALIVEAGGERFAIPQLAVIELVRAQANSEHRIERIKDTPVLRLRNKLLPLIHLKTLLKMDDGAAASRRTASSWSRRSATRPSASWSTACSTPRKSSSSRCRPSCVTSRCSPATPSSATAR